MLLTEKHIITKNHEFFKECDNLSFLAKNLYNYANYLVKNHYNEQLILKEQGLINKISFLSYKQINRILIDSKQVDYYNLPPKVSNQTLRLLEKNWKSFFKANKDYGRNPSKYKAKPKPPSFLHKTKGRAVVTYPIDAISKKSLKKNLIKLSKTNIEFYTKQTNIKEVKISHHLDYYKINVVYFKEDTPKLEDNNRKASIDLGVNNLATITSNVEGFVPIIINGKPLKSNNQYYNKKSSNLKSITKKRNGKESSKRLRKLANKKENKNDDYLHKSSRELVNHLIKNNINELVIGKNDNWKQDASMSKKNNQNFVNIPHSRFIQMIVYKCEIEGISVILQEESYTSKASFLNLDYIPTYGSKKNSNEKFKFSGYRKHRGLYKIKKKFENGGREINADVNGSYNILRKAFPRVFDDGIEGLVVNPMVINIKR
jgi:putative transposase